MSGTRGESAREAIVAAANAHRAQQYPNLPPYNKRQVQQAVQACRHNGLVSGDVLRAAGFNERRPS